MNSPVIGIVLDYQIANTYSSYPWYALREHYSWAVAEYGAVPIMLPYEHSAIDQYLDIIDGFLIPGGDFDIDPRLYGEKIESEHVVMHGKRTEFELNIIKRALDISMPIFGICAGEQLINVALGGTLVQHIPDYNPNGLEHKQTIPNHIPSHQINIEENTKLSEIIKAKHCMVNSRHHQAVKVLGQGLVVSAVAPDGVIEAIELPGKEFVIGVEWHPEYLSTEEDRAIFEAFIAAANRYKFARRLRA